LTPYPRNGGCGEVRCGLTGVGDAGSVRLGLGIVTGIVTNSVLS